MTPYFTNSIKNPKALTDVLEPDRADGHNHGLKSSAIRLPGRGGDIRSHQRTSKKRAVRIVGNKAARNSLKVDLLERLKD